MKELSDHQKSHKNSALLRYDNILFLRNIVATDAAKEFCNIQFNKLDLTYFRN